MKLKSINLTSPLCPLILLTALGTFFIFLRWHISGLQISQFTSLEHLPELKSSATFAFLLWNIFLAWLPLLFAIQFAKSVKKGKALLHSGLLLLLWLLFLPNAPYILTDLLHLRWRHPVPHWFDLMILVLFAWTGWQLGLTSLIKVYRSMASILSKRQALIAVSIAIFLCGPGVYLGRVLRYNSWDLIHQPLAICSDLIAAIVFPLQTPGAGIIWMLAPFLMLTFWIQLNSLQLRGEV